MTEAKAQRAFATGQKVRLRADIRRFGVVTQGPREYIGGVEYAIFIDGREEWISGTQLEAAPSLPRTGIVRPSSGEQLLCDLALAKLARPLNDGLYAVGASRTNFEVYQFRPVLKFLRSWLHGGRGLLIADEVGLGKTIEAAIIFQELKARVDIRRAVVLCPSRLTTKWRDELETRFGEKFDIVDAKAIRRYVSEADRLGDGARFKFIASFEMLRRQEFLDLLSRSTVLVDFLVIDEAHHLRNAETRTHQLGEAMASSADAVVLLSATPLHLRTSDLFNLLRLVAPSDFDDLVFFDTLLAPNRFINEAARHIADGDASSALRALQRVESTDLRKRFCDNPFYRDIIRRLQSVRGEFQFDDRAHVQRQVLDLNTLASVVTRTTKREFSHATVREARTVLVDLSPNERAFYDAVLLQTRFQLEATGKDARGFATVMRERQAASCLPAMRQILADVASKSARPLSFGLEQGALDLSYEYESSDINGDAFEGMTPRLRRSLATLASRIGSQDSKYEQLRNVLKKVLRESSVRKVLVFSFFRHTLDYLQKRLRQDEIPVAVIHGAVKPEERNRIIEEFREGASFRVLLSSEVGAEGLDFQFCDALVNYDLPWNPMQVEQRIGRLDRFGQTAPKIHIFNFFLKDTIETRILQRLYDRIEVFRHAIGDLEDILGEVIRDLRLEILAPHLTPAQENAIAEKAEMRIANLRREREAFDGQESELLGQGALLDQRVKDTIASGRVITSRELDVMLRKYLSGMYPRTDYQSDPGESCASMQFEPGFAQRLDRYLEQFQIHMPLTSPLMTAKSKHGRLAITFDSEVARQRPSLEFVSAYHPLVQVALHDMQISRDVDRGPEPRPSSIDLPGPAEEAGPAWFFVFSVSIQAATNRELLETIVLDEAEGRQLTQTQQDFLRLIQTFAGPGESVEPFLVEDYQFWESCANRLMAVRRDALEQDETMHNKTVLTNRRASIEASINAKIKRLEDRWHNANDERIRRMYASQVRNLQARKTRELEELAGHQQVVVSTHLVAGGRVLIRARDDWEGNQP